MPSPSTKRRAPAATSASEWVRCSSCGAMSAVADDGPGDELREHGHIGGKVDEVPLGRHVAAVDVDDVAEDLKGIKADADGQGHAEQRKGQPRERVKAARGRSPAYLQ